VFVPPGTVPTLEVFGVAESQVVEALLVERDGYVRRGRMDRVAQVDAQLARFGVAVDVPVEDRPARARRRD
jgi:hypothetical protein